MNCKFCNTLLDEETLICPECGADNAEPSTAETEQMPALEELEAVNMEAEAPAKKKISTWAIVGIVAGGLAVLAILVGAVLYGMGINPFAPKPEYDVLAKASYTVSDADAAQKAANTVVATVGTQKLTNSELQVYYWLAANEYISTYSYYLSAIGLDTQKPLDAQVYDEETGMTWQQFFLDNAVQSWHRYTVLSLQAQEEGFSVDAEAQAYVDKIPSDLEAMAAEQGLADVQELISNEISPACNLDGYMAYASNYMIAMEYFEKLFTERVPTQEEIEEYYAANEATLKENGIDKENSKVVDVRHILICPKAEKVDEEGNVMYDERGYTLYTDEAWVQCLEDAQAVLDQWKAGEATEDSFAALATERSEDGGSAANGGLYTDVTKGMMVETFENWCFDPKREVGETGLVETPYGYHIMYYVGGEETWSSAVQETMMSEYGAEVVDEALEKWPLVVDYKKVVLSIPGL